MGLSTKKCNVEQDYIELFRYIINHKNTKKIIFSGSSAGGYPSIKYASIFGQICLVGNPQLYLKKYPSFQTCLVKWLEKYKDKPIYQNNNIEKLILDHKPSKIYLYNNKKIYTTISTCYTICKFLKCK